MAVAGTSAANQSVRPCPSGSLMPSTAGRSPSRSIRVMGVRACSAEAATATVVPVPPLTDQQMVTVMRSSVDPKGETGGCRKRHRT